MCRPLDIGGSERLVLDEGPETQVETVWPALAERLVERKRMDVPGLQHSVHVAIGPIRPVAWLAATVMMGAGELWWAVLPEHVADTLYRR